MRTLLWVSFVLAMAACADDPTGVNIQMRVITPAGEDPFDDATFDRIAITIAQEGAELVAHDSQIGPDFDLPFTITSLSPPTRVRVELHGEQPRFGAPPLFSPIASGGLVRIPVGRPSMCERVTDLDNVPSEGAGVARVDTFLLFAGGESSSEVLLMDLLRLGLAELDPLPTEGIATSASLGPTSALVVQDEAAYRYDLGVDPSRVDRVSLLMLHDDADHTTTLFERADGGILAVGPGDAFSLISPDARVITGRLLSAKENPAVVALGDALLVIGGLPYVELIDRDRGSSRMLLETELPPAHAIVVGERGDRVWLLHNDGTSNVLEGCPDACTVEEGPPVIEGMLEQPWSVRFAGGENLVRASDTLELEVIAELERPANALFPFESGIVMAVDDAGAQLCYPSALTPLP